MTTNIAPVVVAVDGDQDAAAIAYGARAARRAGAPLLLVHVIPQLVVATVASAAVPVRQSEIEAIGCDVLGHATAAARAVLPESEISSKVLVGEVAHLLVDVAAEAQLLVLGNKHVPALARVVAGSVAASVAAHAAVPVVRVPSGWSEGLEEKHRVVVGVKDYDRAPVALLRQAFGIAQEWRATLELAYVWDLPAVYGDVVASILDYPTWQAMVERHLRADLVELEHEFPDVTVEVTAWYGQPAHVLRERSGQADLLILTRRSHGFPFGHFGATGRALLRESACPVEVLPLDEVGPERSLTTVDAGRGDRI